MPLVLLALALAAGTALFVRAHAHAAGGPRPGAHSVAAGPADGAAHHVTR